MIKSDIARRKFIAIPVNGKIKYRLVLYDVLIWAIDKVLEERNILWRK